MAGSRRETAKLIKSTGPKYPCKEMTMGSDGAVKFHSMTDGTNTTIQITLYGEPIGQGFARRHPKDARNQELGMALALVRAFTDVASRYSETLHSIMNPPDDPAYLAISQLRKLTKADSVRRKEIRRKAAREAHREIFGWDHTTFIADNA